MKNKETVYNILLVLLLAAIVIVALVRFVLPGKKDHLQPINFRIDTAESLEIHDLDGRTVKWKEQIQGEENIYILLCKTSDCFSCIHEGVTDLKDLQDAGNSCMVLIIDDNIENVRGWSAANFPFKPFYVIKKVDFYKHIQAALTPVVFNMHNGEVQRYKYILP